MGYNRHLHLVPFVCLFVCLFLAQLKDTFIDFLTVISGNLSGFNDVWAGPLMCMLCSFFTYTTSDDCFALVRALQYDIIMQY